MTTESAVIAANAFDPRKEPAYTVAEASRYLKVAAATLRSWVVGRPHPVSRGVGQLEPLIHPPQAQPPTLSFWNLVEVHVLRALRTEQGVSVEAVREALTFAEEKLDTERLLLSRQLCAEGGELLLGKYGQLIQLRRSGQLALEYLFKKHLERVEWDADEMPSRVFPFMASDSVSAERVVAIDANVAFGRPVVLRAGVSTTAIVDRIDAGEEVEAVADDYDLSPQEITEAVFYERAA